jgi:hypothetical protein
MRENIPGFRSRFHFVKWLGYDTVQKNPLVRMLHEARAKAAAHEKAQPLKQRKSYQIRQLRIYSSGHLTADPNAPATGATGATDATNETDATDETELAETLAIADAEASETTPASEL